MQEAVTVKRVRCKVVITVNGLRGMKQRHHHHHQQQHTQQKSGGMPASGPRYREGRFGLPVYRKREKLLLSGLGGTINQVEYVRDEEKKSKPVKVLVCGSGFPLSSAERLMAVNRR